MIGWLIIIGAVLAAVSLAVVGIGRELVRQAYERGLADGTVVPPGLPTVPPVALGESGGYLVVARRDDEVGNPARQMLAVAAYGVRCRAVVNRHGEPTGKLVVGLDLPDDATVSRVYVHREGN